MSENVVNRLRILSMDYEDALEQAKQFPHSKKGLRAYKDAAAIQFEMSTLTTGAASQRHSDECFRLLSLINEELTRMEATSAAQTPAAKKEHITAPTQKNAPSAECAQEPAAPIEDLLKELDSYIGLKVVKQEVRALVNMVAVRNLRKKHELPNADMSLHLVFAGSPGTGKTTIARMMARIYKSLGILTKGHLVEVDRGDLVSGYVGQTATKTKDVIQKAMGGVLFIDEAYSLNSNSEKDFGQEAIDTILKAMEDHRDDFIVIVAGYDDLMEKFIKSNPGLESRFNYHLHFADYTPDELMAIFDLQCKKNELTLAEDARDELRALIESKNTESSSFGNARGVRNLFEKALRHYANRIAAMETVTKDDLMLLTAEDIRKLYDAESGNN